MERADKRGIRPRSDARGEIFRRQRAVIGAELIERAVEVVRARHVGAAQPVVVVLDGREEPPGSDAGDEHAIAVIARLGRPAGSTIHVEDHRQVQRRACGESDRRVLGSEHAAFPQFQPVRRRSVVHLGIDREVFIRPAGAAGREDFEAAVGQRTAEIEKARAILRAVHRDPQLKRRIAAARGENPIRQVHIRRGDGRTAWQRHLGARERGIGSAIGADEGIPRRASHGIREHRAVGAGARGIAEGITVPQHHRLTARQQRHAGSDRPVCIRRRQCERAAGRRREEDAARVPRNRRDAIVYAQRRERLARRGRDIPGECHLLPGQKSRRRGGEGIDDRREQHWRFSEQRGVGIVALLDLREAQRRVVDFHFGDAEVGIESRRQERRYVAVLTGDDEVEPLVRVQRQRAQVVHGPVHVEPHRHAVVGIDEMVPLIHHRLRHPPHIRRIPVADRAIDAVTAPVE